MKKTFKLPEPVEKLRLLLLPQFCEHCEKFRRLFPHVKTELFENEIGLSGYILGIACTLNDTSDVVLAIFVQRIDTNAEIASADVVWDPSGHIEASIISNAILLSDECAFHDLYTRLPELYAALEESLKINST